MNAASVKTGWRVIQGRSNSFIITKKMHNALQGDDINFTELKMQIYEEVAFENAVRNHIDHDVIIVHDPQPLPLIQHYRKKTPWIWRCHVDPTRPNAGQKRGPFEVGGNSQAFQYSFRSLGIAGISGSPNDPLMRLCLRIWRSRRPAVSDSFL